MAQQRARSRRSPAPRKAVTRRERRASRADRRDRHTQKQVDGLLGFVDGMWLAGPCDPDRWPRRPAEPIPVIAPLPIARAVGVIDEKTLKFLLRFAFPITIDAATNRRAAAKDRDHHLAQERRWRAIVDDIQGALDLMGEDGWLGGRLPGLMYPQSGELFPVELGQLAEQLGYELPGRRIIVDTISARSALQMIRDQVSHLKQGATRDAESASTYADLSPKMRTRLMQTAISEIDRILRRAGWTRSEVADLLVTQHLWKRAPDDFPVAEIASAHRYDPYARDSTRRRADLVKWIENQRHLAAPWVTPRRRPP